MASWWTGPPPPYCLFTPHLCPRFLVHPPIPLLLNQTREPELGPPFMRHVMQVNRSDLQLPTSDPNIHLTIPYIFHFRRFLFPQSSLHLCLFPFFIESHNALLQVGWRIYTSIYEYKQDLRRKKTPQTVKRQPGNTKCCVTMVISWSKNHMNEDDK